MTAPAPKRPARHSTRPPLVRWRSRLRLQDWKIKTRWVSEKEAREDLGVDLEEELSCVAYIVGVGAGGETGHSIQNKEVEICLIDGEFDNSIALSRTILHELLHVLLWPVAPTDDDPIKEGIFEQIINVLEDAIFTENTK